MYCFTKKSDQEMLLNSSQVALNFENDLHHS